MYHKVSLGRVGLYFITDSPEERICQWSLESKFNYWAVTYDLSRLKMLKANGAA